MPSTSPSTSTTCPDRPQQQVDIVEEANDNHVDKRASDNIDDDDDNSDGDTLVSKTSTITIDDALNEHVGFGKFQIILLQICGSGWAYDGIEMAVIPFILPHLTTEWSLDPIRRGLLGAIVFLGMFFGAAIGGMVSDKWGRKVVMLYGMLCTCTFGLLSSLATNYWMFLILRMCVGFGLGGIVPTDYSMVMEFVPQERRGSFVGLINVYYIVGAMIECVLAWCLLSYANWRWLVGISAATGFISFASRLHVPESPRFLIVNKMEVEALESVRRVALWNGIDTEHSPLFQDGVTLVQSSDRESGYSLQVSMFKQLKMILSTRLKQTSILLWIIWFLLSYGSWGFMFLIPIIFNNPSSPVTTFVFPLATYTIAVFGYLISSAIIDKVPRKHMAIISFSASGLSVMLMGLMSGHPVLILIQSMIVNFVMTFAWSVMNIYTPELYPTRCRTTGLGMCNSFTRIGGVVTPLLGQILLSEFGMFLPYLTFGIALAFAAVCVVFLPLETLGMVLQDDLYAYDMSAGGKLKLVYQPVAVDEDHTGMNPVDDFML